MRKCKKCGKDKPLRGCATVCADCKAQKSPGPRELGLAPVRIEDGPDSLTLMLTDYPAIFPRLKEQAIEDFRTTALQALYYVDLMTKEGDTSMAGKKKGPADE